MPRDSVVRHKHEGLGKPGRDINSADRTLPFLLGLFYQLKAARLTDRLLARRWGLAVLRAASLALVCKSLEADWTFRHGELESLFIVGWGQQWVAFERTARK